jgi:TPR repeat protein/tRNA A-37 threonylcarbamoyl transferase component Bud32
MLDGGYRITRVVGSGGFGITYEAEDFNLRTLVAIKEYYPFDFGDRDATMSVRPKSERHKQTFEWGRASFLQEARTLARFEHPSIVRVSRVFEANSTAYMVMRFEQGQNFEAWLKGLGRPPTQGELDRIAAPLLDALEMMHAQKFLHRDIAPDNIIVRTDVTPVLLDFGTARRAVAEMSRALTGIVKAGYSPQEQYASDSRLQGPWSDLYALGGTLYRAVTGKAPEEATLRAIDDSMAPAAKAATGKYRPGFLAAIDACLRSKLAQRPQSVAELRPMLLGQGPQRAPQAPRFAATRKVESVVSPPITISARQVARHWPAIAAIVAVLGGIVGGIAYTAWQGGERSRLDAEAKRQQDVRLAAEKMAAEELARRDAEARRRAEEARLDAERRSVDEKALRAAQAERDFQEGERYLYGRGVLPDYAKAREGYEKAAAAGHSGGMVGLGWLNQSGRGVARDYAKAREWYEKAAAGGNSAGMANLAWLYRDGLGVPRDYGRAREWYEKAAAAGHGGAMANLGWLYQNGLGVPRDYSRAREWYERAAARGNTVGMANLGWLHQSGSGVARDYVKAREWYEKAAAAGNAAGMANLGWLHRDGLGVPRDYAKAREWYEKAVAAGHSGAMISLGSLHRNGLGVPQDLAKAREWYEKAAAAGNAIGMATLGWLYRDATGVQRDYAKAREWFEKAAAAGNGSGMNGLGVLHQNGEGVPKDYAKAREWYEKAAATGEDFSMTNLARLYQNGWGVAQDFAKAREWYDKASNAGNRFAKGNLAYMLDQEKGGRADYPRAAKLLLEAARANNTAVAADLRGDMSKWHAGTRTELKRELSRLGHSAGTIDDRWDDAARTALNAYLAQAK